MKAKIILTANALAFAVAAACSSSYPVDPAPVFTVNVSVLADGVPYPADTKMMGIPANTQRVHLVATVSGPPGDWEFSLATDGALSLGAVDGGVAKSTVHTVSPDKTVDVQVAATLQPLGEAVVTASFGTLTQSFRFVVTPVVPTLEICEPDLDEGCKTPTGAVADMGGPYRDDAGVRWVPYPASPGGTWRDGDRAVLRISSPELPSQEGVAWSGTVTTNGVLSLLDDAAKPTPSRAIQFTQGAGPVIAPVRITGAGAGLALASIGNGPQASLLIQTDSASVVPHRIELIGYTGLRARNRVTLCSSRISGSVGVSLDPGGGTVSPANVPLSVTPDSPCVDPYPGQADFIWTGTDSLPIWTVQNDASPAILVVPTLGTEVAAAFAQPPSVLWLVDGGVDTGNGAIGGLAQVTGALQRTFDTKDGGPPPEALGSTSVEVKTPAGITASPSSFTTDANGYFSFTVTKASWLSTSKVTIFLAVDNRITLPLDIP